MTRTYPPVSLIGAPTDIGAGDRGARLGPEALRIAGLGEALVARGIDVADRGNLDGPRNPWLGPVEGYRHLAEVAEWNRLVMEAMHAELAAGRMPILLGGDHCLGLGSRKSTSKLTCRWVSASIPSSASSITRFITTSSL